MKYLSMAICNVAYLSLIGWLVQHFDNGWWALLILVCYNIGEYCDNERNKPGIN